MYKIKKSWAIFILALIISFLFSMISYSITNSFISALICINFIVTIYAIFYCKYSIYSLIIFLSNYPILPLMYKYYFNTGASSLGISALGLHMKEILLTILIFNIITLLFVLLSKSLKNESKIVYSIYNISKLEVCFFIFITIMSLIISMPHIPFYNASMSNRQAVLIQGGAWNYVGLCAFAFLMATNKNKKIINFIFIFLVVWNIGNYNRADVLSLVIIYVIRLIKLNKISKHKQIKYFSMIFLLFLFSLFVGNYRVSNSMNNNIFIAFINSIGKTINDILNQPTAADIIHIYNVSIDYTQNLGFLHGSTYAFYLYSIVPFLGKVYSNMYLFTNVLNSYYFNLGGGFFLAEPYLNFGILGTILYGIVFNIIMYFILKKNNLINYVYYICIWIVAFRLQWYGLIYLERSFIEILPLYLIIHAFFKFKNAKAFKAINN